VRTTTGEEVELQNLPHGDEGTNRGIVTCETASVKFAQLFI
jgi:hypothetical protein